MQEENNSVSKKAIYEMSPEAKLLLQRLSKLNTEEVVSYDELSQIASIDVRSEKGRGFLNTARKRAISDFKVVVSPVRGRGLKRLKDSALADEGRACVRAIRRKAHRGMVTMAAVDTSKLSRDEFTNHLATVSMVGVLRSFATEKNVDKLMPVVVNNTLELPVGRVLEIVK